MFTELRLAIYAAVLIAFVGGAWAIVRAHDNGVRAAQNAAYQTAVNQAKAKALETEAEWRAKVYDLQHAHDIELGNVAAARDSAIAGLRNRSPRRANVPGPAASACAGASPSALAAEDARVAIGFAAEFDQLRVDYQACQSWIKAVTGSPGK